jgi:hypothetical protein
MRLIGLSIFLVQKIHLFDRASFRTIVSFGLERIFKKGGHVISSSGGDRFFFNRLVM